MLFFLRTCLKKGVASARRGLKAGEAAGAQINTETKTLQCPNRCCLGAAMVKMLHGLCQTQLARM